MDNLMRDIKFLIAEEAKKINKDEPKFKENFFYLVSEIEEMLAVGEEWFAETKKEGFAVNAADAEGYVRALRNVKKAYIDFLKENKEEYEKY